MVFTFRKKYFGATMVLLLVEVFIAFFIKDSLVRPYGGDFLVIFLLYCLVRSFLKVPVNNAILGVLLFAWLVEGLQYLKVTEMLSLKEHPSLSIILGNHFEWLDMFIYTLAAFTLYWLEQVRQTSFSRRQAGS